MSDEKLTLEEIEANLKAYQAERKRHIDELAYLEQHISKLLYLREQAKKNKTEYAFDGTGYIEDEQ